MNPSVFLDSRLQWGCCGDWVKTHRMVSPALPVDGVNLAVAAVSPSFGWERYSFLTSFATPARSVPSPSAPSTP